MARNFKVGDKATLTKAFTEEEVRQFAEMSCDKNPIHLDEEFAKNTPFGTRIVHGMLFSSMFSGILGQQLPGEGTIYLEQNLKFKKPVLIGEELTATVEITNIREDKPIVTCATTCTNAKGEVVLDGTAVVKA